MNESFVYGRVMRSLQITFLIVLLVLSTSPSFAFDTVAEQKNDNDLTHENIEAEPQVPARNLKSSAKNAPLPDQAISPDREAKNQVEQKPDLSQKGTLKVQALGDREGIQTDVEIWALAATENALENMVASGKTNDAGIFQVDLKPGRYIAKVFGAVTQTSDILTVKPDQTSEFVAQFISLELVPYAIGESAPSASLKISGDAELTIGLQPYSKEVLWVTPGTYVLEGPRQRMELTLNGFEQVPVDITLDAVTFGQLEIYANTSDAMPISANYIVYNSTSGAQVTSGTLGSDGFVTMNLAPGDYDVETFASDTYNRIVNTSVTIIGEQTTTVRNSFSQYIVYSDVVTWIYVYDEGGQNVASGYRNSNDINKVFYLPAGIAYDFSLATPAITYYNLSSTVGDKVIVGSIIQEAPYFISYPTIASRVDPNQSTLVTAQVFDRNYDAPLVLDRVVNYGSTFIASSGWVATNVFEFKVNYTAPAFAETYRMDLAVVDTTNLFSNFTLYLSNRQSTVNLNSTGFNDRPITQWIYAYDKYSDAIAASAYTGSTGTAAMVLDDGEYYFVWTSDINYVSAPRYINATYSPYSIHYRWAEVNVNMTGMYGQVIGGTMRLYNAGSLSTPIVSRTISSSTGSQLLVLPAGNYSIKTYASAEASAIWHYDMKLNATERPSVVSSFGVLAVYQFDAASNPQSVWTYLYNATDSLSTSISSVYTGSDGIATYTLAPYGNYTVKSSRSVDEWYYKLSVSAGNVTVIGNFTNSAPVISDITASPRRIGPNENTTVTVTASDIDPIDILNYTWTVTEGTISGSGNQVTYFAPSTVGVYRIEVNVTDQFGGWANTTIWVSSNFGTINVTVTQGGNPDAKWVYIYDGITNDYIGSGYTGSLGYTTFGSIYPGPYKVQVTGSNLWTQYIFVNGGGTDNMEFRFAAITLNATSSNGEGINVAMKTYLNSTGVLESSASTGSTGLLTLALRPGVYDFEATSDGTSIRKNLITVVADEVATYDFKFGRISLTVSTAGGKPISLWTYLYRNSATSVATAYASNGIASYDVAPGTYNLSLSVTPTDWVYGIVVTASGDTPVNYQAGVLAVYTNDGGTALNQPVAVYSEGSLVFSENSGSDGFVIRDLAPGTYDVLVDNNVWTYNVAIMGGERTQVGSRLNRAPVIVAVDSVDVGPSTTQTVTVTASDSDYDYQYLYLDIVANMGVISAVGAFSGFTSTGEFQITFDYTSPSVVGVYQVNVTLYDTFGGNDSIILYLSDNTNPVHLYSFIDNFTPRNTLVTIYDTQTGATVYSSNLGTDGYAQFNIVDGLYDIRFMEDNAIWLYNVEITYGGYYNFSAYFGVVDIYVTTTGGAPVAAWTYAYDHPRTGGAVASKYSGSDGIATYILAPGTYEFDIVQTNTITIVQTVEGGVKSIIGNDVPVLTDPPADFSYLYGTTGNFIAWNFTDASPDYYNITMDGSTVQHGVWNGSIIQINVDGLYPGTYRFTIYVNDTNGLPNQDTVYVTVLPTDEPLINPHGDDSVEAATSYEVSWVVNGANPDVYVVYVDGVMVETGNWVAGFVNITLMDLAIGTYNLTLMINDTLGQSSTDQFFLTVVDTTPPTLIHSGDLTYVSGETGNVITFTPYDSFAPGTYNATLTVDGVPSMIGDWVNGTTYQFNVDGLDPGLYSLFIRITDAAGNEVTALIEVTVLDPTISLQSEPNVASTYEAPADVNLTWIFDAIQISNFTILINGVIITGGLVEDNATVTYMLSGLMAGDYNVTVLVENDYGTKLSHSVYFTVILVPIPGFGTIPSDLEYVNGTTGNSLTWEVFNATWYSVWLDGSMHSSANLTGSVVTVDVDGLAIGVHNVTVEIGNEGNQTAVSTVLVTVIAVSHVLRIISSPSSFLMADDMNQTTLVWTVLASHPDSYSIQVNGSEQENGSFSSGNISFVFIHQGPGMYEIVLKLADMNGTFVTAIIFALVMSATGSSTNSEASFSGGMVLLSLLALAALPIIRRKEVRS